MFARGRLEGFLSLFSSLSLCAIYFFVFYPSFSVCATHTYIYLDILTHVAISGHFILSSVFWSTNQKILFSCRLLGEKVLTFVADWREGRDEFNRRMHGSGTGSKGTYESRLKQEK